MSVASGRALKEMKTITYNIDSNGNKGERQNRNHKWGRTIAYGISAQIVHQKYCHLLRSYP